MDETKEGSPVDLAIVRTKTFDNRKIIMGSTPVKVGTSHIMAGWEDSDQEVRVPRPPIAVTSMNFIEGHIAAEGRSTRRGEPRGTETPETHKGPMVAKGRWRVTKPEVKGHAGYRLNALMSAAQLGGVARAGQGMGGRSGPAGQAKSLHKHCARRAVAGGGR